MDKPDILEDRSFVEYHVMQTIDGKAVGNFWRLPDMWEGFIEYHRVMPEMKAQGLAAGKVAASDIAKGKLDLEKYKGREILEHKDFIVPLASECQYYLFCFDSKGTLPYDKNIINFTAYFPDGTKTLCQIVEVLTDKVSNEYLHFLQEMKISYIFVGEEKINLKLTLQKTKKLFGIDKMLLLGGPTLSGAFLNEDLIDAFNVFIGPITADGDRTCFNPSKIVEFKLVFVKELCNSNVWLKYVKKN